MSDDSKSTKTAPEATDGWVESPVREAPDAPLVPTRRREEQPRSTKPATKPAADDEMWTTKSEIPATIGGVTVPDIPGEEKKPPKPEPLSDIGPAKGMAILAHTSILLALPVFLVPLVMRDNSFALQHAKAAGVNFLFFVLFGIAAVLTRGVAVPLMFLCYIPSLVGIVNAANGDRASFWALGSLGEKVFNTQPKRTGAEPKKLPKNE